MVNTDKPNSMNYSKSKRTLLLILLFIVSTGTLLFSQKNYTQKKSRIMTNQNKYGVEGYQAPELFKDIKWVDAKGKDTKSIQLVDHKGNFKVIYCFQSWCPGCHSRGLPALQQMQEALKGNDKVSLFAIQTVFEGKSANTYEEMKKVQKKYDLAIPFGHDEGNEETGSISSTMRNYRTGGTPWFILIDQNDTVIFNDFHLNTEKAIEYIQEVTTGKKVTTE